MAYERIISKVSTACLVLNIQPVSNQTRSPASAEKGQQNSTAHTEATESQAGTLQTQPPCIMHIIWVTCRCVDCAQMTSL